MTPEQLAARGVRVKPLVWQPDSGKHEYPPREKAALPDGSTYSVTKNVGNDGWCWFRNSYLVFPDRQTSGQTVGTAKAAAEADHAARICAALEMMEDGE